MRVNDASPHQPDHQRPTYPDVLLRVLGLELDDLADPLSLVCARQVWEGHGACVCDC